MHRFGVEAQGRSGMHRVRVDAQGRDGCTGSG